GGSQLIVLGIVFDNVNPSGRCLHAPENEPISLELALLMPRERHWYRYEGSLTTPDASGTYPEVVSWLGFNHPIQIPADVLGKLAPSQQPDRAPMPLDRRFVLRNFR